MTSFGPKGSSGGVGRVSMQHQSQSSSNPLVVRNLEHNCSGEVPVKWMEGGGGRPERLYYPYLFAIPKSPSKSSVCSYFGKWKIA
jgi:hypothetical protein